MDKARWVIYDQHDVLATLNGVGARFRTRAELMEFLSKNPSENAIHVLVNPELDLVREAKTNLRRAHLVISETDSKASAPLFKRGIIFDRRWEKVWLPSDEFVSERTSIYRDGADLKRRLESFLSEESNGG